jgi:hypothetical protein
MKQLLSYRCAVALWASLTLHANAPKYVYTATAEFEHDAWMSGKNRFPAGSSIVVVTGHQRYTIPMHASADPEISLDGLRVLFSGKALASDHWQIWELTVETHSLRQLFPAPHDCIKPLYLANGDVVYTEVSESGTRIKRHMRMTGDRQDLTFAPSAFLASQVLNDGRILVESNYPNANGRVARLFTLYPDGTGFMAFRPGTMGPESDPRELANGDVVVRSGDCLARYSKSEEIKTAIANPRPLCGLTSPIAEIATGIWIISRYKRGLAELERFGGASVVLQKS